MKEFFKMFFATLLAMAVVVVGGAVVLVVGVGALSSMSKPKPVVVEDSVLVFNMSGNIQDSPVSQSEQEVINQVLGQDSPQRYALRDVLSSIRLAAEDEDIKGLYIKGQFQPSGYGSGFAALKEVREAILDFKESGKPTLAHVTYPSSLSLYVASAADRIYMNPEGMLLSSGFASQPMFLAGFFEKYGIGVQVTKAGEYKSAAESFVLKKMSEPAREQTEALIFDLWDEYVAAVAGKAEITSEEFQEILDTRGLLSADDALEIGIVDKLAFAEEIIEELKEITGEESEKSKFKATSLAKYIQSNNTNKSAKNGYVAVVYAEGAIVVGEGEQGQVGGDRIAREIRQLRENNKVKAIVLRVNSPGGSAFASEVIQHELRLAKEDVPVVVSMGTVAASGGYWISTYADKIFAEPNTITGSIGVIGLFMNFQEIANNHGFTFDTVKTAKFADFMSVARPKTEEEMEIIQDEIDHIYEDFLAKVAEGRNLPIEEVAEIAGGRVWSGEDALEVGLVDEIGGLEAAIAHAGELADLGSDPAVRDFPKPKDFFDELIKNLSQNTMIGQSNVLVDTVQSVFEEVESLATTFNDPKGVYAILPYRLDIQ